MYNNAWSFLNELHNDISEEMFWKENQKFSKVLKQINDKKPHNNKMIPLYLQM